MTYKQIEGSREIRLWIGQVIVPAALATAYILNAHPEIKNDLHWKKVAIETKIRNTFSKKVESK